MSTPYLTIDLDKIEHNARSIVELCKRHGIAVSGVTKGVCGAPEIARAMLRGGVVSIADSRLINIRRMRAAGIDAPFMLLRLPSLSAVDDVVAATQSSLNSEPAVLAALAASARRQNLRHDAILMVELGDLREGVWPDRLPAIIERALTLDGIDIRGLGTNLACFGGVIPQQDNMQAFVDLVENMEKTFALEFEILSAINSSGLDLIAAGRMPQRINHARIGEAILLGRETTQRKPWPDTSQDAFVIHAEVLEVGQKPSLPLGDRGLDAFGARIEFEDRGISMRALLDIGREDIDVAGLTPLAAGVQIIGASSGYLVLDVGAAQPTPRVGDRLSFFPNYSALLRAMTSEYVDKRFLRKMPKAP